MGWTYSARLVAEFLDGAGVEYTPHSSRACLSFFYDHGIRAVVWRRAGMAEDGADTLYMSIQTCPVVAGDAFAETALQSTHAGGASAFECGALGYGAGVIRHATPDALFLHIAAVRDRLASSPALAERVYTRTRTAHTEDDEDDRQDDGEDGDGHEDAVMP